jgi:AcrR family transcriptional regulator
VSTTARDELLAAAVDHAEHHGLSGLSLRALAAALGTSHRMLIYHFGSREGLLVAITKAVEQRQRDALADLASDPEASVQEIGARFWARLTDPALAPQERLFFELYAQGLQGEPHALPFLQGIVDDWLAPLTELVKRAGAADEHAAAEARLGLAVSRGLLLDLLATGDRAGVDAAMARFNALFDRG